MNTEITIDNVRFQQILEKIFKYEHADVHSSDIFEKLLHYTFQK